MKNYKILVFTYGDTNSHYGCSFSDLLKITNASKEEYCETHGYDFYCRTEGIRTDRAIGWEKIQIICDHIDKYDYIFYVECDAMIMNHTIRIENLIDDNYDITTSIHKNANEYEINAGVLLIKCSEWSKNFLNKLCKKEEFHHHNWAEQAAIINELKTNTETRKHFKFVSNRYFNSYAHKWYPEDNFQIGDFVLHAAGSSNDYRFQLFNEMKNYIIKMPKINIKTEFFL
jgi:hypothetical protein